MRYMTVKDILDYVDEIKQNSFSRKTKLIWLNELEYRVQTDVMLLAAESITYIPDDDTYTLLVPAPWSEIYYDYILMKLSEHLEESSEQNNRAATFDKAFTRFMRWWADTYRPANGNALFKGYYLKGEKGEDGAFRVNVTYSDGVYSADKTFDEIKAAYNAGQQPYVVQTSGASDIVYTLAGSYLPSGGAGQEFVSFERYLIFGDTLKTERLRIFSYTLESGSNIELQVSPYSGGGGSAVELDTTLTQSGKAADAKAVGDAIPAYKINLDKYSISADGTNATATTDGINQAIADAVAAGCGTIVFPKGEYLIAGSDQINITGRLTVDFNHSVLRKEANANESYVMMEISGDHNVVKNATLYGDRETHDYSSGGTHEGGKGIYISPDSRFTIIENVDVFDTTGYGMCTGTAYNQIEPIINRPLEAGCYDKGTGELVGSTTHTILGYTLDITDSAIRNNMFILGGNGYAAHGIKEPLSFYMSFYDENETYIGFSSDYRLYDTIDLKSLLYWYPALRYIKFSIENTDTGTNVTLELRSSYTSDDITIKNCEIARCRTLGIAITGGKRILVENVSIHDIGGAAPGYGVDIEDGYQLNQYIVFRSCEFYNNKFGNIIVVKTRDVLVENCRFQGFQRPEGGTAVPAGISAHGTITSKFVVRDSVFTGCSAGGEKFYLYNCIFIDCPGMEGDFTECRFHGCQIINLHGTTLNRCYLNGTRLRYRNGNFGCYDSVLESVSQEDENWDTGNPAVFWVMEGCLLKNCAPYPKTGVTYIRIANNTAYLKFDKSYCFIMNTKQKTHCQIVGNTFEQGGRGGVIYITDTYGSEIYMEGNVFKSLLTKSESVVNAIRLDIRCTGRVSFNANTFDIGYMVASLPVLNLENCAKATLTNNKFFGDYGLPIKMTSVTEAICDGNEYTGTPVLAENCKGVDIPNTCSKSYVDGLIGDVSAVIASINSVVGGA